MQNVMPSEVPVLSGRNMCIGPLIQGKCGCLLHYAETVFLGVCDGPNAPLGVALAKAHGDFGTGIPQRNTKRGIVEYATTLEDEGKVSRHLAARIWNRAMAYLGYVVGNPECTKRGTLRKVRKAKR